MRDYKKYDVWNKAHQLVKDIYLMTNNFPNTEKYGLLSQLRRAAVSIPTNIVEGSARSSDADFRRFLYISSASAAEVEYLLILSKELKFMEENNSLDLIERTNHVRRMLNNFIKSIKP